MTSPQRSASGGTARGRAGRAQAAREWRQPKERSMRKGFFASVAALATGAGAALGQGYPGAMPGNPAMIGSGPGGPPAPSSSFYGAGPAAYPAGPTDLPPAPEMPLYGQV